VTRISNPAPRLRIADLIVDARERRVLRGSDALHLAKLTFDLLLALAERAPAVVTQDELAATIWAGRAVSPETIAQRVKLLRKALGDDAHDPRYLRVLRGQGYQIVPPVEICAESDSISAGSAAQAPRQSPPGGVGERWSSRSKRIAAALAAGIVAIAGHRPSDSQTAPTDSAADIRPLMRPIRRRRPCANVDDESFLGWALPRDSWVYTASGQKCYR
jgi:DNA-binding winged helix-turn-helix (wHTH) protein